MARSLLIVDDHPVVLFGMRFLFQGRKDVSICGEARDAVSARELAERFQPDFVVLDLVLGGRDGLELLRELTSVSPLSRTLIYSSQSERVMARKCRNAGAWGYVSKTEGLPVIAKAITEIATGSRYFPGIQDLARHASDDTNKVPVERLSTRELQVLRMIGEGMSTQEMSRMLEVSAKTVGTYRERIKVKLSLSDSRSLNDVAGAYVGGRIE